MNKEEKEKYWISTHKLISKENLVVLNEYLLSLKLANKAEATVMKYRWAVPFKN